MRTHRRVLAFDFDGTLALDGQVPLELTQALQSLQRDGYALFLVTGRQLETVTLGELAPLFMGIVWENGAVLFYAATGELYLPFGQINVRLVEALQARDVPLERGLAIVATHSRWAEVVWQVLTEEGSEAVVVQNKGALMILPSGTSKGAGLARMLELCGLSSRNLVAFGDAENDQSLFQIAESAIAPADAVPVLQKMASLVTEAPGPAGVLEALHTYWLGSQPRELPRREELLIALGHDDARDPVSLPAPMLIRSNLGVFGDSGSGKSWVTGLIAEGMHLAGYQFLLIDPEGNFRGLRSLPGVIALSGSQRSMATPETVCTVLEEASISVVLDLCTCPVGAQTDYVAALLHMLAPLREHRFRPHWIVLEEAQRFLPLNDNEVSMQLLPLLAAGGWALVTYRPDRLNPSMLAALRPCLIARLSDPETIAALRQIVQLPEEAVLAHIVQGDIWLTGRGQIHLRSGGRRVPHIRHLYKYLDLPLPRHKRFYFRTAKGYLNLEAASLFEFREVLSMLPEESLIYHQARGDFAAWAEGALDDEVLALQLDKLAHREALTGEALRRALLERVRARYAEIYAKR